MLTQFRSLRAWRECTGFSSNDMSGKTAINWFVMHFDNNVAWTKQMVDVDDNLLYLLQNQLANNILRLQSTYFRRTLRSQSISQMIAVDHNLLCHRLTSRAQWITKMMGFDGNLLCIRLTWPTCSTNPHRSFLNRTIWRKDGSHDDGS